jgi:hypothetical protein
LLRVASCAWVSMPTTISQAMALATLTYGRVCGRSSWQPPPRSTSTGSR